MRFSRLAVAAVAVGLAARAASAASRTRRRGTSAGRRTWRSRGKRCEVYFFEEGGIGQTHNFHPNQYLETTAVWTDLVRITRLWKSQTAKPLGIEGIDRAKMDFDHGRIEQSKGQMNI